MTGPPPNAASSAPVRLAAGYPFVWALFPPLALYEHNQRYYRLPDLLLPVVGTLLVTAVFWLLAGLRWKGVHERAFRTFTMVFCFHLSGHAASYCRGLPMDVMGREVDLGDVAGWAVLLLALGLLACRLPTEPTKLTRVLAVFSVVLVAMPALRVAKAEVGRLARRDLHFQGGALSVVRQVPLATAPHIFYVIPDGYARHDVLQAAYGLDNTPFLDALRQRGFYVATRSESNYFGTVESLASSLNMSYLDALSDESRREGDNWSANRAINRSRVAEALRGKGYSFVAFGTGIGITEAREADVFIDVEHRPFVDDKFFQTAVGLTPLRGLKVVGLAGERHLEDLHRQRVLHTLATAPTLAASAAPVFALVHVICPHWPAAFDAEGNMPAQSTGDEWATKAYADQVRFMNGRILRMVDEILANAKRPVVIVVQGDHGPGPPPRRVGREMVVSPERRRILNAYLFPDRRYERLYDKITPVNTFRIILSQYCGFDIPLQADRRSD